MEKDIIKKLWIREGYNAVFVKAPRGYVQSIGNFPAYVKISSTPTRNSDFIQVFVYHKKDLQDNIPKITSLMKDSGSLWITYPKGSILKDIDINRDSIAKYCESLGLKSVAMISIDDKWSAFRFKKASSSRMNANAHDVEESVSYVISQAAVF